MNSAIPHDPVFLSPDASPERQSLPVSDHNCPPYTENNTDATLLDVLTRIQNALRHLDLPEYDDDCVLDGQLPGTRLVQGLAEAVNRLQNTFMDALYAGLEQAGIDPTEKITLRLDDKARLVPGGPHSEDHKLAALLDARPDLTAAFIEIALRSTLLRDIRGLQIGSSYASAADACLALLGTSSRNGYQVSLKGDMNHFYFSR